MPQRITDVVSMVIVQQQQRPNGNKKKPGKNRTAARSKGGHAGYCPCLEKGSSVEETGLIACVPGVAAGGTVGAMLARTSEAMCPSIGASAAARLSSPTTIRITGYV